MMYEKTYKIKPIEWTTEKAVLRISGKQFRSSIAQYLLLVYDSMLSNNWVFEYDDDEGDSELRQFDTKEKAFAAAEQFRFDKITSELIEVPKSTDA